MRVLKKSPVYRRKKEEELRTHFLSEKGWLLAMDTTGQGVRVSWSEPEWRQPSSSHPCIEMSCFFHHETHSGIWVKTVFSFLDVLI